MSLFPPPSLTTLLPVSKLVLLQIALLLLPDDDCSKFKTYFILFVHPISHIGLVPSWLSDLVDVGWFLFFGLITYVIFFIRQVFFVEHLSYYDPCDHVWFSPLHYSFYSYCCFCPVMSIRTTKKKCCWYFYLVTWNYIINLTYLKTFTITKHGHNLFVFYNNFLYLLIQHKIWILDCISSLLTSRSGRCGMISFLD
jgi:hypothetical protein